MNDTGISLDANLPFDWEEENSVSSSMLEQRRHGNISLLKALAAIESAAQENEDVPESMRKGLERIESKLDMLLMLVARVAQETMSLPPDREVSLSQTHIHWTEPSPPRLQAGQMLKIRLFLSPRLPQPLVMQAIVGNHVSSRISADLVGLDEELGEWLTRTIFRYHRRAVHARKQP